MLASRSNKIRREKELAKAEDETKPKAETEPTDEQAGSTEVMDVVISRL